MIDTRIGDLNALAEKQSEVNSLFYASCHL